MLLAGGVALLVVEEPALASFPDENGKIAFVKGSEIYTMNDDGSDVNLLTDGDDYGRFPAWSPDGTRIAFVGNQGIYVMNSDGSDVTRLTSDSADGSPTWSPDGTRIAFVGRRETPPSPDEAECINDAYQEIYIVDLDTSNITRLTDFNQGDPSGCNEFYISSPDWSPDGTKIAYDYTSESTDYPYVHTITVDSSSGGGFYIFGSTPDWSPDGNKIVYDALDNALEAYIRDVYVLGSNDANPKNLTKNDASTYAEEPVWSPNGAGVAYASGNGTGPSGIYTMDADGSGSAFLAEGSNPDWQAVATDTTPPNALLDQTSGPSGLVTTRSATFDFYSTERGTQTFECKLDAAPFTTCVSPVSYSDLNDSGHTFEVRAADAAGNSDATPARREWSVDATEPAVIPPVPGLVAGSVLGTATAPAELAWSGTDNGSGIKEYQLQQSTNGGAYSDIVLSTKTATLATLSLDPGKTYQYRVRAQDQAGNWSSWATSPNFTVDRRQENNKASTYKGAWNLQALATASGGYVKHAATLGAKARFFFAVRNVAWVAPMGPNRGKAEVWVDGTKVATVDLYSPETRPREMVFTKSWNSSGSHTLTIKVLGKKNAASGGKRVDVDAFVALR